MKRNIKIISITLISLLVIFGLNYFVNYSLSNERPDELYKKMKEISDNQSLIGLSKEEVKELLGEPIYKFDNETGDVYSYNAGRIDTGLFVRNTAIFFGCTYICELRMSFDENDKVASSSIHRNG